MSFESVAPPTLVPAIDPCSDFSGTSRDFVSNNGTTPSSANGIFPAPGTLRRPIRGMPKKSLLSDATIASLSARTSAWNHSHVPRSDAGGTAVKTSCSEVEPSPQPDPIPISASRNSQAPSALAHYFQQLQVSTEGQTLDSDASATSFRQDEAIIQKVSPSKMETPFRFPSLPPHLIDEGFHYRQRAAQFILLYSQQATREQLSRCNLLSLPLMARDPGTTSRSVGTSRRTTATQRSSQHEHEHPSSAHDEDSDSNHSHHHTNIASDDDGEYLDFDTCRTVHLGNKKKRKSSRFSNSGLPSLSNGDRCFTEHPHVDSTPSSHSNDLAAGDLIKSQSRALVDKTNMSHNLPLQSSVAVADKHPQAGFVPSKPASVQPHTFVRLPFRQTSGERHTSILRKRIRARLAPIFGRRRLDRWQQQLRTQQEVQTRQEANALHDVDKRDAGSPERKAPPKRVSKAGKRAQAIRGGNSSVRPLTIAEIRARAAAASEGSPNIPVKSSSRPASSSPNGRIVTNDAKQRSSSPSESLERPPSVKPSPPAAIQAKGGQLSTASEGAAADNDVTVSQQKISAPTSSFDFRMSSAVTLRLRELRSQLDAATRHPSNTVEEGNVRPGANGLSPAALRSARSSPPRNGNDRGDLRVTDQSHRHAYRSPSLVHGGSSLRQADDVLRTSNAESRLVSRSVKDQKAPSLATGSEARSRTLTTHRGQQQSTTASPNSTSTPASVNGDRAPASRRTAAQKTPSRKRDTACKHGHANGHGRPHGSGSALFTDDDWICVFCEYELYYGETPLMLRACRNRKKLVEKKSKVKSKAQAALQKKASNKTHVNGCHHDHDHEHEHDHGHTCHHDRSSVSGSDDCCCHDHDHDHSHRGDCGHGSDWNTEGRHRAQPQSRSSHHVDGSATDEHLHRERCDCGNSIHSSDFGDEDR
ncbi:hypothetical protein PHSY_004843 [Pseudozyma hubeiensis SY62]|uniref:Uncharacterized protein n=1 Tax=Pseudozyma hubeiensis (strain SY62) TaxID=1305764 RepID=R9P789_PSEHS|nr:hypothetical protein PHSY_004843 [Pseudozyma hubeiensis SY62]GAC97258.1 hypothetical protein PHSY_004843 [Pseudozyma hubeiensis SY62]